MVKAADLRMIATKVVDRRNMICDEIKRLERLLLQSAKEGSTSCKFGMGDVGTDDPVYKAVMAYCKENGFSCVDVSIDEPIGFHQGTWHTILQISWALYDD